MNNLLKSKILTLLDNIHSWLVNLQAEINDDPIFTGFTKDEQKFIDLTTKCLHCQYFHGVKYEGVDLICGFYPAGNPSNTCIDFKLKQEW